MQVFPYRSYLFVACLLAVWIGAPQEPIRAAAPQATPISSITAKPGFRVELVRSAGAAEGSWISMSFDDSGRIILGLDRAGVARLTLPSSDGPAKYELLDSGIRHCRGVLFAHNSIYVTGTNDQGLYRLQDTTGDDQFDKKELLTPLEYRSRYGHGANQMVLGPDNMIYVVCGNDISFPHGVSPASPYRNPQNDHLLPNPHDAGHDNRVGTIARVDPHGKEWEIIAGGLRNQVDIAFNADGEMFTFDADMEWDVGLPWYRPTRVNHLVSGGEYGWRWGTGKWPVYYEDSLPSTLDCGLSSPTGLAFGAASNFPPRYRSALFMGDWQHGRILMVDLQPRGASYHAQYELFLEGAPLNVCDLTFGPDGAMYFITGGRGSQSGLYRVIATEQSQGADPAPKIDPQQLAKARDARAIRHQLEKYHTRRDESAVSFVWPYLNDDDRWLRFAARVALENQPVEQWKDKALAETDPATAITALLALCRTGDAKSSDVMKALLRINVDSLDADQQAAFFRALQVRFIRLGEPTKEERQAAIAGLRTFYPNDSAAANHLLSDLLIYLGDPQATIATVKLLSSDTSTQEEQIRYARALTHAQVGWSPATRAQMLRWIDHARRFVGGKLVSASVRDIQADFLATLTDDQKSSADLAPLIAALATPLAEAPSAPPRAVVQNWKLPDLLSLTEPSTGNASFENGRRAMLAASCLKCHRLGSTGGQVGPNLTQVGKRFDNRAILESILTPAKAIDPKYGYTAYVLTNGKLIVGRATQVGAASIVVETDPVSGASVTVQRSQIEEASPAKISPMPSGLIDVLTHQEIRDLLAYLRAGGNPNHRLYED